jgi:hypothetical protein
MIERPSGPTAAMTAISFVPGGKLTTRVPGSAPSSTLRFVGVEVVWSGALTSGFVTFEFVFEGEVAFSEGVTGVTRAIGKPITTTYTARNAPTKPRPKCTTSSKSPLAPLPPHHALGTLRMTRERTSTFYLRPNPDFSPSTPSARPTSLTSELVHSPHRVLPVHVTPINHARAARASVIAASRSRLGNLSASRRH